MPRTTQTAALHSALDDALGSEPARFEAGALSFLLTRCAEGLRVDLFCDGKPQLIGITEPVGGINVGAHITMALVEAIAAAEDPMYQLALLFAASEVTGAF